MSRLTPAVEAVAHIAFVRPGSPCTLCGGVAHRGGYWAGVGAEVYICGPSCAEKLIHLALDTLADHESPDRTERSFYARWLRLASEVFDRWAEASTRRRGRAP